MTFSAKATQKCIPWWTLKRRTLQSPKTTVSWPYIPAPTSQPPHPKISIQFQISIPTASTKHQCHACKLLPYNVILYHGFHKNNYNGGLDPKNTVSTLCRTLQSHIGNLCIFVSTKVDALVTFIQSG